LKDKNLLRLKEELGFFTLNKDLEKLYLEKEEEKELLNKSRIEYEKKTKEAKNGNKLLVYCENTNASNLNSL
jgi:hypothetical protein